MYNRLNNALVAFAILRLNAVETVIHWTSQRARRTLPAKQSGALLRWQAV